MAYFKAEVDQFRKAKAGEIKAIEKGQYIFLGSSG